MNNKNPTYKKHILNFRQWSRKGYAVFSSLGKVVRIAVLNRATSDRLLDKSSFIESFNNLLFTENLDNETNTNLIEELEVICSLNKGVFSSIIALPTRNDYNKNNTKPNFSCPVSFH